MKIDFSWKTEDDVNGEKVIVLCGKSFMTLKVCWKKGKRYLECVTRERTDTFSTFNDCSEKYDKKEKTFM
jgi:hypothetical protein